MSYKETVSQTDVPTVDQLAQPTEDTNLHAYFAKLQEYDGDPRLMASEAGVRAMGYTALADLLKQPK